MDLLSAVLEDHDRIRKMLKEYNGNKNASMHEKSTLYGKIREELLVHHQTEELVWYPEIISRNETSDISWESLAEHRVIDVILKDIDDGILIEPLKNMEVKALKEVVEKHLDEEENDVFPLMKKLYSQQELDSMGDLFESQETELRNTGLKRAA